MLLCKIWALRIEGSEREDEPGWQLSNPLEVAPLSFCEGGPKQKRRPIGLAFVWMVRLGRRCSQRSFVTSSWLAVGSLLGDQRTVLRFTTSRSHYRGLRLATDLLTTDRLPALRSSAFSNWHTILKQRNTSTVWSVLETEDFDRFLFADCSAAKIVSGTIFFPVFMFDRAVIILVIILSSNRGYIDMYFTRNVITLQKKMFVY